MEAALDKDIDQTSFDFDVNDYISHHGILGMKWGKLNGPPYPIGSGDHSAREKRAAKQAGVQVGKDSGKGSIENVKLKDKAVPYDHNNPPKGITKNPSQISKIEQHEGATITKAETQEEHETRRKAALESGDYRQIKAVAKESSYNEVNTALLKADTMRRIDEAIEKDIAKQNPPKKTVWDKLDNVKNKTDKIVGYYNTASNAWNAFAKTYNTFSKSGTKLPIINNNDQQKKDNNQNNQQQNQQKQKNQNNNQQQNQQNQQKQQSNNQNQSQQGPTVNNTYNYYNDNRHESDNRTQTQTNNVNFNWGDSNRYSREFSSGGFADVYEESTVVDDEPARIGTNALARIGIEDKRR